MHHVVIIKASEHVQYGIALPDIGKELVAHTLAVARALDETCDIDNLNRRRNGPLWIANLRKHLQPPVRHVCRAQIRLNSTEREIGALGLA